MRKRNQLADPLMNPIMWLTTAENSKAAVNLRSDLHVHIGGRDPSEPLNGLSIIIRIVRAECANASK